MHVIGRVTRARDEQRGFTMIVAILVLCAVSLLLFAAIDAALGDVDATRNDLNQKRALLAAEAGLSAYTQQLDTNPDYWQTCPTATAVAVPGSTDDYSTETYSFANVPATGQASCSTTSPFNSMIETTGTFRVKITGYSGPAGHQVARTIVGQYKPQSFLDYVYFTNYEIFDPHITGSSESACAVYYWAGRNNGSCGGPIWFETGDTIDGPVHSNDDVAVGGDPTFGRSSSDAVEIPGFYTSSGSAASTSCGCNIVGTYNSNAGTLDMPPNDSQLLQVADGGNGSLNGCSSSAGCVFTGPTTIVLNGSGTTMTVTNAGYNSGNAATLNYPANGVIYINNSSCSAIYTPYTINYSAAYNAGCGNATVQGYYSKALTIGAANDIIINGSITTPVDGSGTPTGTAMLGLIADDFVRIYHPLTGTRSGTSAYDCPTSNNTNGSGSLSNPVIYAAILAIDHSFTVDNFDCGGSSLGNLEVYGAIAQNFRGAVGSSTPTGYVKDYIYDDRLQDESPPYFLNPSDAGWELVRRTECDTAC